MVFGFTMGMGISDYFVFLTLVTSFFFTAKYVLKKRFKALSGFSLNLWSAVLATVGCPFLLILVIMLVMGYVDMPE
jgi:hypothetical protein